MASNDVKTKESIPLQEKSKPRRRRLRVGDPDFKPPDGGWGWVVVIACGISNACTSPMFQQFGLVFREKFKGIGFTSSQTTTITNVNFAFNSCVGLLNGPLFKILTYRQVAMFGAGLVMISLLISRFCASFWTYLIFYSICYGSGIGINQSSNALALNTYFKERRRIATGLSWTITAIGPVVWPYVITALRNEYGMEGTLLIFAALAGHALAGSCALQPVEWHTKYKEIEEGPENLEPLIDESLEKRKLSNHFENKLSKSKSNIFSSQYLFNEDDHHSTGYEIIDPGTPMMTRSNDGWFSQNKSLSGSKTSLASSRSKGQCGTPSSDISKRPSFSNVGDVKYKRSISASSDKEIKDRKRKISQNETVIEEETDEKTTPPKEDDKLLPGGKKTEIVCTDEKDVLNIAAKRLEEYKDNKENHDINNKHNNDDKDPNEKEKLTLWEKIYIFFDFDLLKDPIYVNLMLGITIANFAEINFSVLTPLILKEFQFSDYQVAIFMSLLAATDICIRFFVPFVAGKIGWDNKTFFLFGVLSMAFGRILLVHTQTFEIGVLVAVIIGAGKGLRTIFMALVIPSHVPLEKLPAASGLQLATAGIFFLSVGPAVGWVRDYFDNYVITLHVLNIMTYTTAVAWTIERMISSRRKRAMAAKESRVAATKS